MSNRKGRILAAFLIGTLFLSGCAAKQFHAPLPPGAINQFDADTYNVLITAQAAINQAKATYGKEYYGSINIAITAYNTALSAYKAWHDAGGGSTGTVQAAITGMLTAVANLNKQQGITPKPVLQSDGPEPPPLCYPKPCPPTLSRIEPITMTGGAL